MTGNQKPDSGQNVHVSAGDVEPKWSEEPDPNAQHLIVWDGQAGQYRVLERDGDDYRRGSKVYSSEKLTVMAMRSGWRFLAVCLPPPPETGWEWADGATELEASTMGDDCDIPF